MASWDDVRRIAMALPQTVEHESGVIFTTPHFDRWPSVLIRLEEIAVPEVEELIVEAWLVQAPKRLAKEYLAGAGRTAPGNSA